MSNKIRIEWVDLKAVDVANKQDLSEKWEANWYAWLDDNKLIKTENLPSYVDDVLEYDSKDDFPDDWESWKIYVATDTVIPYRRSGSDYVKINDMSKEDVKSLYESNDDTNAFTDDLKDKLDWIADWAETNVQPDYNETDTWVDSFIKNKPDLSVYEITDNKLTSFQDTPDDTHYISEKLAKNSLDAKVNTEDWKWLSANDFTDTLKDKLDWVEDSATADQTDAEIKTAYENNDDTNVFNDDAKNKLDWIAENAEVNVQVDYTETDDTLDSFVKNKPDLSVYQTTANMIDEDDMASDSDTKYPTQQSVKKYVNDNISWSKLQYFWNNKLITESFTTADWQNQIMIWDIELDDDVEITVWDDSNLTILDV